MVDVADVGACNAFKDAGLKRTLVPVRRNHKQACLKGKKAKVSGCASAAPSGCLVHECRASHSADPFRQRRRAPGLGGGRGGESDPPPTAPPFFSESSLFFFFLFCLNVEQTQMKGETVVWGKRARAEVRKRGEGGGGDRVRGLC